MSPYGETKLVGEWMLRDRPRRRACAGPRCATSTSPAPATPELADLGVFNLVPMVFEALDRGRAARSLRRRLPDPATAPASATTSTSSTSPRRTSRPPRGWTTAPLRRGLQRRPRRGHQRQGGARHRPRGDRHRLHAWTSSGRRPGDAPAYFADATKIGKELGWTARLDLSDMVRQRLVRPGRSSSVGRGSRAAGPPPRPRCVRRRAELGQDVGHVHADRLAR